MDASSALSWLPAAITLGGLAVHWGMLRAELKELRESHASTDKKLDQILERQGKHATDVAVLQEQVSTLRAQITAHAVEIGMIRAQLADRHPTGPYPAQPSAR